MRLRRSFGGFVTALRRLVELDGDGFETALALGAMGANVLQDGDASATLLQQIGEWAQGFDLRDDALAFGDTGVEAGELLLDAVALALGLFEALDGKAGLL